MVRVSGSTKSTHKSEPSSVLSPLVDAHLAPASGHDHGPMAPASGRSGPMAPVSGHDHGPMAPVVTWPQPLVTTMVRSQT